MLKLQSQSIVRNYYLPNATLNGKEIHNIEIEEDRATHTRKVWSGYVGMGTCIYKGDGDDISIMKEILLNIDEKDILLRYEWFFYYLEYDGNDYDEKVDIVIYEKKQFFFISSIYKGHELQPLSNQVSYPTKEINQAHGYTIEEMIEKLNKMYGDLYSNTIENYKKTI